MENNIDRLLVGIKQGQINDFEGLYKTMSKSVFAFAISILGDKSLSEDAVHETFLRVQKMAHSYVPGTNGTAWVLTITRNLCLNIIKKRKFEIESQQIEDLTNTYYDIEDTLDRFLLQEALTKLNYVERQIVLLYSVSGLKHWEIADLLHIPQATERWHYIKALKKLKKFLQHYEHGWRWNG